MCLGALAFFPSNSRSSPLDASAKADERHYWANIGGGIGLAHGGIGGDPAGVAGGISLSYRKGSSLFSIRQVSVAELQLVLWENSGPPDRVWDVGVLYGRVTKVPYGLASISGGLGLVGDNENSHSRMGIPIEGQLFWTPGSLVGFGLYGFANLNSKKSFVGVLLYLQIGKLK